MPTTYLITGANRGLGLEFARQLTSRGDRVIATARDPSRAADLARLTRDIVPLDVQDPGSIASLAERTAGRTIDVLINNAGVSSESKSVESLDAAELQRVLMVNSISPMLVVKALLKGLRASQRRMIFNITSMLGSIALNTGGSSYGYRASKAALNQFTVSLANELRPEGFTCVVAHPGWVKTDMGGSEAPLTPQESVRHLINLIDSLKPLDTGKFFNYDGTTLAW